MHPMNTTILTAAMLASQAAAFPEQTSWTDFYPTEHPLWYEQPLEAGAATGVYSNRLNNDLSGQIMDDFEVPNDASIDEVVFYGWAYHEGQQRWALMNENISAFTVEIWSGEVDWDGGCFFRPNVMLASKSVWLGGIDRVLTGDVSEDGSFIERLSITLDQPVPVSSGARYGVKISATTMNSDTPIGFKWAQTDEGHFAFAYDTVAFSCSPTWWLDGWPVYYDMAFELAGPGFGDIVHRQLADHETGVYASTTNSESDPTRVYDDFVSGFDGRVDAVSVYMTSCWNDPTGSSIGAVGGAREVEVAIHEVIEHGDGTWEPGELVGRTAVASEDLVSTPAFRQRIREDGWQGREWFRATIEMNPPVQVRSGRRYAVSMAGEMERATNSLVTAWAETVESSLQDNGLRAVEKDLETGAFTMLDTGFAFTVHGLSMPWCGVADVAEPFGLLDLADVTSFAGAFTTQDYAADLNGDGLLDLSDVIRFIESFLAGCPVIE